MWQSMEINNGLKKGIKHTVTTVSSLEINCDPKGTLLIRERPRRLRESQILPRLIFAEDAV
jgi:hypothetical protein